MNQTARQCVVFIIPSLYRAGAERVLHEVVTHLDRGRFERHVVCFTEADSPFQFDPEVKFHYLFAKGQLPVSDGLITGVALRVKLLIRLSRLLADFPRDALLVPFLEPPAVYVMLTQFLVRRRYVISLHTIESIYLRNRYPSRLRRTMEERLLEDACIHADKVVVPSDAAKLDLSNHYLIPPDKIVVIPNPVNLDKIRILRSQNHQFEHLLDADTALFVHVGRLAKEKNHRLLIEAASLLKRRGERFRVLCIGSGGSEPEIKRWIREEELENYIIMVGELDNVYALMSKARALILTSHYESFGMVLIEAMASCTAVISVNCPHGPAEVLDHGTYGILIPPNNPQALADAMLAIDHNEQLVQDLQKKGQERAAKYDVSTIVKYWENVLQANYDGLVKSQAAIFNSTGAW